MKKYKVDINHGYEYDNNILFNFLKIIDLFCTSILHSESNNYNGQYRFYFNLKTPEIDG